MTAGSALWQTVFLSFAAVLLLFEVVRGWRLGLLRQLARGAAIVAGYAAAYFGGDLLLPLLRPILKWPDFLISMLGGALLALVVYGVIASLGSILFKRTAQQSSGTVRLVYGLSGALAGLCFGAFFIWLILVGIRSVGSVAEAQVNARPKTAATPNAVSRPLRPSRREEPPPSLTQIDADSLTTFIARLKNSVELGPVGDAVKKTDVTPASVYQTLHDVGTICANPESAQRFLSFPGAVELSQHPKIIALRDDPEIAALISQGRVLELLQHPRVLDAANDPSLVAKVKQFDLKKALEFAAKGEE
ncbi:MAG TPA: CvpA family protein [Chthoniobacterales bacterium]|nr:CvpA family protein [Chthoniobacterales bacterium]